MPDKERREYQRLNVAFRVVPLASEEAAAEEPDVQSALAMVTQDISPSGMFYVAPAGLHPECGQKLAFELVVPPGVGYSASEGRIRGNGTVVRTTSMGESKAGLAVRFTDPLSLDF
jgi:c-di-GMP-binding flagellar brake protein YcgR